MFKNFNLVFTSRRYSARNVRPSRWNPDQAVDHPESVTFATQSSSRTPSPSSVRTLAAIYRLPSSHWLSYLPKYRFAGPLQTEKDSYLIGRLLSSHLINHSFFPLPNLTRNYILRPPLFFVERLVPPFFLLHLLSIFSLTSEIDKSLRNILRWNWFSQRILPFVPTIPR